MTVRAKKRARRETANRIPLAQFVLGAMIVYAIIIMLLAGLNAIGKASSISLANRDIFHTREIACSYHVQTAMTVTGDFNTGICVFYKGQRFVFVIDSITTNAVRLLQYNPNRLFIFNPDMTRRIDLDGDSDPDVSFTLADTNAKGATFDISLVGYPEDLSQFQQNQPVQEEPAQFIPEGTTQPKVITSQQQGAVQVNQQEIPPVQVIEESKAAQVWNMIVVVGIFFVFAILVVGVIKRKSIFHQ